MILSEVILVISHRLLLLVQTININNMEKCLVNKLLVIINNNKLRMDGEMICKVNYTGEVWKVYTDQEDFNKIHIIPHDGVSFIISSVTYSDEFVLPSKETALFVTEGSNGTFNITNKHLITTFGVGGSMTTKSAYNGDISEDFGDMIKLTKLDLGLSNAKGDIIDMVVSQRSFGRLSCDKLITTFIFNQTSVKIGGLSEPNYYQESYIKWNTNEHGITTLQYIHADDSVKYKFSIAKDGSFTQESI